MSQTRRRQVLGIAILLAVAAGLRLWRLESAPIWLDEAVTALIAAGRGPDVFPLGRAVPVERVAEIFEPVVTATPGQAYRVFQDPRVQDLHPPSFHLLSNLWLRLHPFERWPLVARVRVLAALFGIAAVAAMYWAARQAFDRRVAVIAAAWMAASPYAVAMSREARNYSYAMLLATISIGAALAILRRIQSDDFVPIRLWLLWSSASVLGLYAHYFMMFTCAAEAVIVVYVAARRRSSSAVAGVCAASAVVALAFAPWVPTLRTHAASGEQRWLMFNERGGVARMAYDIASSWENMAVGKAWDLPAPVSTATRGFELVLFVLLIGLVAVGFRRATVSSPDGRSARAVAGILAVALLAFVAAIVVERKNFVAEPRYHVVYYPALVLLVAWAIRRLPTSATGALLVVCVVNSAMVDVDVESWKGTDAGAAAARIVAAPRPSLIAVGADSYNERVGESVFVLAAINAGARDSVEVAFVPRPQAADAGADLSAREFWDGVKRVHLAARPASVLVHSNGLRAADYPPSFHIAQPSALPLFCTGIGLDTIASEPDELVPHPAFRPYHCQ